MFSNIINMLTMSSNIIYVKDKHKLKMVLRLNFASSTLATTAAEGP